MKRYLTTIIIAVIIAGNLYGKEMDDLSMIKTKKTLIVSGLTTLGTIYVTTIILDHTIDNSVNFPQNYVPGIGPFLAIGVYDSKVNPYYSGIQRDKALLAISGGIQTCSIIVAVIGAVIGKEKTSLSKEFKNGNILTVSLYSESIASIGSALTYEF